MISVEEIAGEVVGGVSEDSLGSRTDDLQKYIVAFDFLFQMYYFSARNNAVFFKNLSLNVSFFEEWPLLAGDEHISSGLKLIKSYLERINEEDHMDKAASDYGHLFVKQKGAFAKPWESAHKNIDPDIFGDAASRIESFYCAFGFDVFKDAKGPVDHIGLEFAFMAHLGGLAIEAKEKDDETGLLMCLLAQQSFARENIMTWVPGCVDLVAKYAKTDLYFGLGMLTRGVLKPMAMHFCAGDVGVTSILDR